MKLLPIAVSLFAVIIPRALAAQEPVESGIVPELFRREKPFEFTIRTNMRDLINHTGREEGYQQAMVIMNNDESTDTIPARIRTRGTFRKDTNNCDFPPLRLNFKKADVRNTVFGPQDEFRIVTHCRSVDTNFIKYVYREYYVYKIYQALSPIGLNVRLARITYEDDSGKYRPFTRDGFILEDEDEFATRLNMEQVSAKISFEQIDEENGLNLAMFQFMIGNTDWIVAFAKNLVFLNKGKSIFAIPYDFDYCGIVNADYRNETGYSKLSYPERIFKGKCYNDEQLQGAYKFFRKSRKNIMRVLYNARMLDHESYVFMYNYITQFYAILQSKKEKQKYFYINCTEKVPGIVN